MEARTSTIPNENVFFLLIGALFSAPIMLVGGGYVSGGVLLFSFIAFIVSLTPVFFLKKIVLEPCKVRSNYHPVISRKELTQLNDPLLM